MSLPELQTPLPLEALEDERPSRGPAPSGTVIIRRPDVALLLAHDLRTPLAAISLNLEFVLAEAERLSESTREALADCMSANARAARLVSDMAEAARIARDGSRPVTDLADVQLLLGEAVRNLEPERAVRRAHVTVRGEPTQTRCDPKLLARALERLLEWVLRHAPPGGQVELVCRDHVVSMRARASNPTSGPGSTPASLATHYADAVLRSHGGGVWTEIDEAGDLHVTIALPP